jgi:hypothetical protein
MVVCEGNLEVQLDQLLRDKPELYQIPKVEGYPKSLIVSPSNEAMMEGMENILLSWETLCFFYKLYQSKLDELINLSRESMGPIGRSAEFRRNRTTYLDLRRQFVPSIDLIFSDDLTRSRLSQFVDSDFFVPVTYIGDPRVPDKKERGKRKKEYLHLLELGKEIDEFMIKEPSRTSIKEGATKDVQEMGERFYDLIFERRRLSCLLDVAREGASFLQVLNEIVASLVRSGKTDLRRYEIIDKLIGAEKRIFTKLEVGFNENWEDNCAVPNIPICIFKGYKRSEASLMYCLDPTTNLLFFTSQNPADKAQAIAILFDVTDESGEEYLLLEGVVTNNQFTQIGPLNSQLRETPANCSLNPDYTQRKYHLDLILDEVVQYAQKRGKPLLINLNEVTGPEEVGPHEMLVYLANVFGIPYTLNVFNDPRDRSRVLVGSQENIFLQRRHLRKDNKPLQEILEREGIILPQEYVSNGRIKLYNHSWSNPKVPVSWVNSCEGEVPVLRI